MPLFAPATIAPGFPKRDDVRERYAERSGRDLGQIDFFIALGFWKLAIILEGVYARYASGQYGKTDEGFQEFAKIVERLARGGEGSGEPAALSSEGGQGAAGTTTRGRPHRAARRYRSRSRGPLDVRHASDELLLGLQEADPRRAVVHRDDPARPRAVDDRGGRVAPIVGPAPTGRKRRSTPRARRPARAAARAGRSRRSGRCAGRRDRRRRSCSGRARCRLRRRARRRSRSPRRSGFQAPGGRAEIVGSPAIASTPLWSTCSCVTSSRSTPSALDRRVVELHSPVRASPDMSPKGSMKTLPPLAGQGEGGLPVPLNAHVVPPVSEMLAGGRFAAGSSPWW